MKNGYSFLLKNNSLRQYKRIAYIITLLNLLFFTWFVFFSQKQYSTVTGKLFVFAIISSFFFEWLYKKIAAKKDWRFTINYLLLLFGWIFIAGNYWMALLHLLLAVMDVLVRKDIVLQFTTGGVMQSQGVFKKQYNWNEFSNIVLKDGLLTLDFKNNKIRYFDISEDVNENMFNTFCIQQLTA